MPATVGAPLPLGWVWPVVPQMLLPAFTSGEAFRPVDAAQLRAFSAPTGCGPLEVAPNVWVRPLCVPLPRMTDSAAVPRKMSFAGATPPTDVDLRTSGWDGRIKYQQMAGVCWSFAISTVMEVALRKSAIQTEIAPLHLVADDEWNVLHAHGAGTDTVLETSWRYDPVKACRFDHNTDTDCDTAYHVRENTWQSDPELVGEKQHADQTGLYRITRIETLRIPADPNEFASVLANGEAIETTVNINAAVWQRGVGTDGIVPDWTPDRSEHAIALVGYRTVATGRQFLVHNSWSTSWGAGGYGWISDSMVRQNVRDAFTVEVRGRGGAPLPIGGSPPTPAPVTPGFPWPLPLPIPFPSNGQPCPTGSARDLIFGTCVAPCPSGNAPNAGVCL